MSRGSNPIANWLWAGGCRGGAGEGTENWVTAAQLIAPPGSTFASEPHIQEILRPMGRVLVLALAAAVYPTLLAIVILILTRPHPTRLFAGYLIGGMAMSLTVGLLILAFADTSNLDSNSSSSPDPWISIFLGLVLLAIWRQLAAGRDLPGAQRRRRRKERAAEKQATKEAGKEPKESVATRLIARDSPLLAIVIGAALSLPSLWYLSALKEIDAGHYSTPAKAGLLIGFNLIMFALIEVPLALYLLKPEQAAAGVARADAWTRGHKHEIGVWLSGVGGLVLIAHGLLGLF